MFNRFYGALSLTGDQLNLRSNNDHRGSYRAVSTERGFVISIDPRTEKLEQSSGLAQLRGVIVALSGWAKSPSESKHLTAYQAAASYFESGLKFTTNLLGDFSIVVWDERIRRLTLMTDPLASQQIYYAMNRGCFYFASSVAQILHLDPSIANNLDHGFIGELLTGQIIDYEATIYSGIRRLPFGSRLQLANGKLSTERYFEPRRAPAIRLKHYSEYVEALRSLLQTSITDRLTSGPQPAFELSGGVDSSTIVAIAAEQLRALGTTSSKPTTFSVSFPKLECDESSQVELFQSYLPTDHHTVLAPAFGLDFYLERSRSTLDLPDYPPATAAVVLRDAASKAGFKTLLTGCGADELFGPTANGREHNFWFDSLKAILPQSGLNYLRRLSRGTPPIPHWIAKPFAKQIALSERLHRLPFTLYNLPNFQRERIDATFFGWAAYHYAMEHRLSSDFELFSMHPYRDRRVVEFVLGAPRELFLDSLAPKQILRDAGINTVPNQIRNRTEKPDYASFFHRELLRLAPPLLQQRPLFVERMGWVESTGLSQLIAQALSPDTPFSEAHRSSLLPLWQIISFGIWDLARSEAKQVVGSMQTGS